MSPNDNPNLAIPANQKLKTPLKASVVILTSFILAACGTSGGSQSYNLDEVFGSSELTKKELENAKKAKEEAEKAEKDAKDKAEAEKKEKEEALKAKEEAEKAKEEAEKAKEEAEKAKEEAEQALEDALAGGGNKAELEKIAEEKAKEAEAAQKAAEEKAKQAQEALQAAQDALEAAKIKNAPESDKSGVQTLNVNVKPLNKVYKTTTRDFTADDNSVVARADIASESAPGAGDGQLDQLTITTSGEGDKEVAGSNGFKAHDDNATVEALGQKLPLAYTSTYKDFGDDMRIGHIDGKAVFSGIELPVNGAAVIGNATKAENMPTEGTVGYTGDATHRKLGIGNAIEFGSSVFTADFVAKNLTGKLSFKNAGDINLKAGINGNKFSGKADANDGYTTEGGFYGGDAQYLGGVYEGKGAQGTYGAKSDKQTAADKAVADAQAAADAAKAEAEAAKAAAAKAEAEAEKAKKRAENAGSGDGEALAKAEARAEAAEKAQAAAEKAKKAAEEALEAAKKAADKAVGEAKAEADAAVAEANKKLEDAKAEADAANAAAEKAKTDAEALVAKANEQKKQAEADALKAQQEAEDAKKSAATAQAEADKAREAAAEADENLKAAQAKIKELQEELDNIGSGGNVDVDELKEKLEAAKKVEKQLQDELEAAQKASEEALAAAQKQAQDAQDALQAANDAAKAAEIKNAPESEKSGVQSLNINAGSLGVFNKTTREFSVSEDGSVIEARADLASQNPETPDQPGLLPKVDITTSAEGDTELDNGFKEHKDDAEITVAALGQTLPLAYTSTYKDFGDDMRIGHIHGGAEVELLKTTLPVDGVAVIGNATKAENMPTEGTVGYTGDATHRELGLDNEIEYGSSVFTADFVAKNLAGKLSFANAGNIALKAGIDGNKFSGAADGNAGYATEGGFYGGDAQYLGGVYEGNGAQGTYGAKSDEQTAAEQAAADAQKAAAAAQAEADKANAVAQEAQKAAQEAQDQLAEKQSEIDRLKRRIDNAGSGNSDVLEQLQEDLDKAIKGAKQAEQQKEEALAQLSAAQENIKDLKDKVEGLEGNNTELKEQLAQANKDLEDAKNNLNAKDDEIQKQKDSLEDLKAQLDQAIKDKEKAEEELAESEKLPEPPQNPDVAASSTITGVQSNNMDAQSLTYNETLRGGIVDNKSASFDVLTTRVNELDTIYVSDPLDLTLRGVSDKSYKGSDFKEHTKTITVKGTGAAGLVDKSRNLAYTSVYNNFNDNMQIGHVYGVLDSTVDGKLSTVYAQGKSTSAENMKYMKELSQYNIDNKLNDGKVNYEGVATYMENGNIDGPVMGSSKFDVDFVDQQVDGSLSFDGMKDKKLKAEITGNKFAGNWNGLDTQGGFYGDDADLLGGVYSDGKGKGTYGAEKVDPEAPEPEPKKEVTGVMSNTLSSVETKFLGVPVTDNAIGYRQFITDKQTFNETTGAKDDPIPVIVEDDNVDNIKFDSIEARVDIVQPAKFPNTATLTTVRDNDVAVEGTDFMKSAGKNEATFTEIPSPIGNVELIYAYDSVYRNFDSVMQIGHVYGDIRKDSGTASGVKSRYANVYVVGHATENMPTEGTAQYAGVATYTDKVHLGSGDVTMPTLNGTSEFDVDFVNKSLAGKLEFADIDKKIDIAANIEGNKFSNDLASTGYGKGAVEVSGGFYGDDAQFLGGIYQEAQAEGGKGTTNGTGSTFQGTFGAEKQ